MRWTAAALGVLATMRLAAAQAAPPAPVPAEPPAAEPPAAELTAGAAVDPRDDAAWQLYHEVFAALLAGERSRARELASTLLRDHPDHPATQLVRGAQLGLAPGAPGVIDAHGASAADRDNRETASRGARAELALFQSLHGIALGIETCVAISCDSAGAVLGLPLIGGAIGAGVALNVHDLTPGERALINTGTVLGAGNAALLLIASNTDDAETIALGLIAGQSIGLVGGAALFRLHPTAGQVALATSGGVWVGALTSLTYLATGAGLDQHLRSAGALIAIDAGVAAGAYLASRWPTISRAQTLVIDAGGIVGVVAGAGVGVLISGETKGRMLPAAAAVGGALGLGAAAYFSRDWTEGGESSLHGFLAPPAHGRGGVGGVSFAW